MGYLGGGFQYFLFSPLFGEDEPNFDEHIFQRGWFNHQLERFQLQMRLFVITPI